MAVYWYKKFAVKNQKGQRDVWWNPAIDIISVPEGLQWEPWKRCVDVCTKQFPLETERDPSSCFGLLLFAVEERVSLPGRALRENVPIQKGRELIRYLGDLWNRRQGVVKDLNKLLTRAKEVLLIDAVVGVGVFGTPGMGTPREDMRLHAR
jgi:hypothetical protein